MLPSAEAPKLPKISIVTPSFNQGQFLEECLLSVLNQDYPHLEYIVIDGGSTDQSREIIDKYQSRLAYWVSEPDGGQADAINKGCKEATGEVVAWLNSDDLYLPGALAAVAAAYLKDPQAPFYFGDGYRVDGVGSRLGLFFPDGKIFFGRAAMIYGLNHILQPATFINRQHLAQVNYLDPSLRYGLDSDLWIRLSAKRMPVPIPMPLAASREYGSTKTSTGSFKRIEELRQIAEKHSGLPMTPGALSYFLGTLHHLAIERQHVFPAQFRMHLEMFWRTTQHLLAHYGERPDGFLETPPDQPLIPLIEKETPPGGGNGGKGLQHSVRLSSRKAVKVGIDLRHITLGNAGGIALLVKGVLETMFQRYPQPEYHLFTTVFNRGLLENVPAHVHVYTLRIDEYVKEVEQILEDEKLEVLFRGYPIEDNLDFPLERQVVLIPDIQHEIYPEFFDAATLRSRRHVFNSVLNGAGAVGTISAFARQTLLDHEWTRCQDIFLMTPALSVGQEAEDEAVLSEEEQALIPRGDFFLYPANLWPHKNHRRILQAFGALLQRTGRQVTFVFTGHPDGWQDIRRDFPTLPIRHLGFVRPELLRALLARTRALVFLSLYEGFGMPLLDAFHAGTPVLCSNTTSLPEVGGDAVLSCDPTDVAAMSRLMQRLIEEPHLRTELASRGKERLRLYTWESSARHLVDALLRVTKRAGQVSVPSVVQSTPAGLPLVTIVTPSFNQGRYLRRTIESVLNQTYPRIEYLVIDGGSTDKSLDILRSYGARFAWVSEPDKGQTDAINKGFARAHGAIRAYLNSDDMLAPDAVAKAVDYLRRHPECDLVYGKGAYIDQEDRFLAMYNTREYSFEELMAYCCICQPAAFWRARIAAKIGPFDDRLSYAMDYEYWLRLDRAGGRIEHYPELLAYSRLYPETKTLSGRDKVYREIFEICQRHGGNVHYNYFLGLWDYLCKERQTGWARRLGRIPGFCTKIAPRLHFRWHHRDQITWRRFPHALLRASKHPVASAARKVLGPVKKALRWLGDQVLPGILSGKLVRGFWSDNWLEPTCRIVLKKRLTGHALRLAGMAPVDMTLQVRLDGRLVKTVPLRAKQYETVRFHLQPGRGKILTLQFSDHICDPGQRQQSFLLQETNLFMEQDLC